MLLVCHMLTTAESFFSFLSRFFSLLSWKAKFAWSNNFYVIGCFCLRFVSSTHRVVYQMTEYRPISTMDENMFSWYDFYTRESSKFLQLNRTFCGVKAFLVFFLLGSIPNQIVIRIYFECRTMHELTLIDIWLHSWIFHQFNVIAWHRFRFMMFEKLFLNGNALFMMQKLFLR